MALSFVGPSVSRPFRVYLLEPHGLGDPLRVQWDAAIANADPSLWPVPYHGDGSDQFRIFAGQPDPADATHFTFNYESMGEERNGGRLASERRHREAPSAEGAEHHAMTTDPPHLQYVRRCRGTDAGPSGGGPDCWRCSHSPSSSQSAGGRGHGVRLGCTRRSGSAWRTWPRRGRWSTPATRTMSALSAARRGPLKPHRPTAGLWWTRLCRPHLQCRGTPSRTWTDLLICWHPSLPAPPTHGQQRSAGGRGVWWADARREGRPCPVLPSHLAGDVAPPAGAALGGQHHHREQLSVDGGGAGVRRGEDDSIPSHFTIDVDVDGERKVIDGWLQSDDTVKLRVP